MASEFMHVLKNKNKYESEERKQRSIEIEALREEGLFRVALNKQLGIIRNLLEDDLISSVEIVIDDMISFGRAIANYEELKDFNIIQKTENVFIVSRKEI